MYVKDLMNCLSKFPENYDVQIPVVPEGYMSPYLLIVDGGPGKRQIWITAMGHAGGIGNHSGIKLDERGNFVRDDHFDDERSCPGAYNGDFNELGGCMKYGVYGVNAKSYVLYKGVKMTWGDFCDKCRLLPYRLQDNDPVESRKCAACGETLPIGRDCILSCESEKIWCCCQCVLDYFGAEDGWEVDWKV